MSTMLLIRLPAGLWMAGVYASGYNQSSPPVGRTRRWPARAVRPMLAPRAPVRDSNGGRADASRRPINVRASVFSQFVTTAMCIVPHYRTLFSPTIQRRTPAQNQAPPVAATDSLALWYGRHILVPSLPPLAYLFHDVWGHGAKRINFVHSGVWRRRLATGKWPLSPPDLDRTLQFSPFFNIFFVFLADSKSL